jgi:hypothetical protein
VVTQNASCKGCWLKGEVDDGVALPRIDEDEPARQS